jgi:hypothetical protein
MIKAAEKAGFKVTPNCQSQDIVAATKNPNNKQIVYHTHGQEDGTLNYWHANVEKRAPVTTLFKPEEMKGKTVTITSCHPDKAVDPYKPAYDAAGGKLQPVTGKQNPDGTTNRSDNHAALTNFFNSQAK